MREGLLTVSTASPVSPWVSRSTAPPGKALSFSLISSGWKPWPAEYRLLFLEEEEDGTQGGFNEGTGSTGLMQARVHLHLGHLGDAFIQCDLQ